MISGGRIILMTYPVLNDGFIDIHCHILSGLDDGAEDFETSLKMLEIARRDGIGGIVATPHIMDGVYDNTREAINSTASRLMEDADAPPLYTGADIRICRDLMQKVANNELPLINDKNYILLELPTYGLPPISELLNIASSLRMKGITPIITHPERNMAIVNYPTIMKKLIKYGAIFQATAMSITGGFGSRVQKFTLKMIKNGHIHVVASDAHDTEKRPPILSDAYAFVSKKFNKNEADRLFRSNPLNIIRGMATN